MTTRLETLGGLRVYRDGQELVALPGRRVQCALLVYLAIERQATRDSVMTLLWPEKDVARARRSLNNTVYELRLELGEDWVTAHGDLLRISDDFETDVQRLEVAFEEARFADAVAIASGRFLEGHHLTSSVEYGHWVDQQEARIAGLQRSARSHHVRNTYQAGQLQAARRAARAWVSETPLDDSAQYWLIRLLAETGHTTDALRQHERFENVFRDTFEADPPNAIRELGEQIRRGEIAGPEAPARPDADTVRQAEEGKDAASVTPDDSWRPEHGWIRKLVTALSLYAVPAAGLLQVLDSLIDYMGLPRTFFPAAVVLILGGIPVVAVTAFLQSQPVRSRRVQGLRFLAARWFSWRNAALAATAALAAWTTAVLGWIWFTPDQRLDPNQVVVFPLASTSAIENPDAGWDVALAIGGALEHTQPLKFVDGWRELEPEQREDPTTVTPAIARAVSRARGAGRYMDGAMRVFGDSLSVTLRLYDVAVDDLIGRETVTEHRDRSTLPALSLRAVNRLLPELVEPGRVVDITPLTDRAPASMALWLQGEKAYRRSRFDEALTFFDRALGEDPRHGLAAIKGAQAASWVSDFGQAEAMIDRALHEAESLPGKYRLFARGWSSYLRGDAAASVAALDSALRVDPNWPEAEMALGEAYYHLLPPSGFTPDSVAEVWFSSAFARDSGFAPPLYHLTEIALRRGDTDRADDLIERWEAFDPDTVLLQQVSMSRGCVASGSFDWTAEVPERARAVLQAGTALAGGARQVRCAEAALTAIHEADLPRSWRWSAMLGLQGLAAAQGRFLEAEAMLEPWIEAGELFAHLVFVYDAVAGAPFADQVERADSIVRERFGEHYETIDAAIRGEFTWHLSLWHALSDDSARSAGILREARADARETGRSDLSALVTSLDARGALTRTDTTTAIELLRAMAPMGSRNALSSQLAAPQAAERMLLAELLLARGRYAEAIQVASYLDHPGPVMYLPFVSGSLELRLSAARALGDGDLTKRFEARLSRLGRGGEDDLSPH